MGLSRLWRLALGRRDAAKSNGNHTRRRWFGAKRQRSAPAIALLENDTLTRTLALGLRWQAIVTTQRRGGRDAEVLAHVAGASHFVGAVKGLVGFGVLTKDATSLKAAERNAPLAAGLLAAQQSADGVFALTLPDQRVWWVVLHGGRPTGAEELLTQAEVMQRLPQVEVGVPIWTDLTLPPTCRDAGRVYSFLDLMQLPATPQARVVPVPPQVFWARIPRFWRLVGVGGLALLGGSQAWEMWQSQRRDELLAQMQREAAQREAAALDELANTRRELLASLRLDRDVSTLRERINELPFQLHGWQLQSVVCEAAQQPTEGQKGWTCVASYGVQSTSGFMPFSSLARQVPDWAGLEMRPTRQFDLHFVGSTIATPLTDDTLPTVAQHMEGVVSTLQQHLVHLPDVNEIRFEPMPIAVPRGVDGAQIPLPDHFKVPKRAELILSARIAVLDGLMHRLPPGAIDWRELRIQVPTSPSAAPSAEDITMTFKGAIYAL